MIGGTAEIKDGLGGPTFAMTSEIMNNLTATGRMADVHGVLEVQMLRQDREIVRIVIHIVTGGGLGRAPVAATVMGDNAKAAIQKEHHLRIPVVRRQRPAMRKHHGRPAAPIFVEDVNAIFRAHLFHRIRSLTLVDWPSHTLVKWPTTLKLTHGMRLSHPPNG